MKVEPRITGVKAESSSDQSSSGEVYGQFHPEGDNEVKTSLSYSGYHQGHSALTCKACFLLASDSGSTDLRPLTISRVFPK